MSPLYETATFEYLKWQDKYLKEKPYQILSGLDPGETSISNSNLIFETGPLERVRDVRGEEGNYCLDEHGFAFRKVDSTFWNFDDREKVERDFIPNVVEPFILENVGGANRIVVFDWHVSYETGLYGCWR
jgi:hypothetical protein